MKETRRQFLNWLSKIAAGTFLSTIWPSRFAVGAKTTKIGVIAPITGPFAPDGAEIAYAATVAVEDINNSGGINKSPVELIVYDTNFSPSSIDIAFQKCSQKGGSAVICMFSGKFASAAAERYKIPVFTHNTFENSLPQGEIQYTFRLQPTVDFLAQKTIPYLIEIGRRAHLRPRSFALFWANNWKLVVDLFKKSAEQNGIRLLYNCPISYQANFNLYGHLRSAMQQGPDLLFYIGDDHYFDTFLNSLHATGRAPRALISFSNPVLSSPRKLSEKGKKYLYIMDINIWGNPRLPSTRKFKQKYYKRLGHYPFGFSYQTYSAINIIRDAINGRSNHPQAVAKTLHQYRWHPYLLAQKQTIWFDYRGRNKTATPVLLQAGNPVPIVIYPEIYAEREAVYPLKVG